MNLLFRDLGGSPPSPAGSVVCIGAFDGLHRGHQALIDRARRRASALDLPLVALSFEPLPREYFQPGDPPARLQSPVAKIVGLRALGVDQVGLLRFNAALVALSAESFIEQALVARLRAREVWVGPDFRFGHRRSGDLALLQAMGAIHGYSTCTQPLVEIDGERVSSSAVRRALASGELQHAADLLGRPYAIAGRVRRGRQLGRRLGFPTANLGFGGKRPAIHGIFATLVHGLGDRPWPSVSSIGSRPTVDGRGTLLEVHLFDFDGQIYGRRIEVEFVAKLRDEEKFDGMPALVEQMRRDALQARTILGIRPHPLTPTTPAP